jgi:hypothetical protein
MYRDAAKALEDVEYILFGRDDHFHSHLNQAEDAVGKLPEMVESYLATVRRAMLVSRRSAIATADRREANLNGAHQADSQYLAVWKIGKWRDLPKDFKPAFERMEGAIPDVAYENGKFYKLVNHWTRYGWPEVEKIELGKDDVLVWKKGGGVEGLLLGESA